MSSTTKSEMMRLTMNVNMKAAQIGAKPPRSGKPFVRIMSLLPAHRKKAVKSGLPLPRSLLLSAARNRKRQGSSEVEQGTHKPLVGSSILPPGTSGYPRWIPFPNSRSSASIGRPMTLEKLPSKCAIISPLSS